MATSTESGRIRFRISWVMLPMPGPYSTMTPARCQSIRESIRLTKNRELGTIEPNHCGCLKKLRANSRVREEAARRRGQ